MERCHHPLVGKMEIQSFEVKENPLKLVISWSVLKAISIMKISISFLDIRNMLRNRTILDLIFGDF